MTEAELTAARQAYVEEHMEKEKKNYQKARKLWLAGLFGTHRFYLNTIASGLVLLTLTLLCVFIALTDIGFVILAFVVVWWIIDFFRLQKMVDMQNERLHQYFIEEAQRRVR